MSRFASLSDTLFDVAIIGGGIIGAGIARDAAMRGLSVALFEKADYGGGTTAGSTRLIHGGLRYLEMLDFGLVRTDLREREILLRIAPHLVRPLCFVLPFYDRSLLYRWRMRAGLWLYDLLSYDKSLPNRRVLTVEDLRTQEPRLAQSHLQGGASYYDAQAPLPERLCIENIIAATAAGARTFNYAEVVGALHAGNRVAGLRVRDLLDNGDDDRGAEIRAKLVVNASGPWFDRVARRISGSEDAPPRIRTTKGIHIALPPMTQHAMVLFSPIDGRLVFVIPWLGYSWIGTTDTDYTGDPADAHATAADVDYMLASVKPFFPDVDRERIFFSNAGVRALVQDEGSESSVSRAHRIVDGDEAGAPGVVAVLGSKLTAYRAIAEEATDRVCKLLGLDASRPCRTADVPLPGAQSASHGHSLPSAVIDGYDLDIAMQVRIAVREEQCARLVDFVFRRTPLGFTPDQGAAVAERIANAMATELGWSAERTTYELALYARTVAQTQAFRRPATSGPTTSA
jgi:glycerol-3-phosphate dehydrogenase